MRLVEFGSGPLLVLIPGIQGRWQYLGPAVDALASSFRVVTFPLCGEPDCDVRFDPALGFDNDARIILEAIDRHGFERAIICGISFGGLPAIRFAATHPERTAALVLVSTPGPQWRLRPRHEVYARKSWLFGPLFLVESPFRVFREIRAALPTWRARWEFVRWQLGTLARSPLSPARMAARAALIAGTDIVPDCARVRAATLLVTGERDLDRIVRVDATLAYLRLVAGARHATIENTGHLGSITRAALFASIVKEFVESLGDAGMDVERRTEVLRCNNQSGNPDAA